MYYLSIVVPVYSGEDYLVSLTERVAKVRERITKENWPVSIGELIFVDDASIDRSAELIDELALKYNWVVALHHSRNFGQHPATVTGILHSSGDWIATIDEDLQHPPEILTETLVELIKQRADIMYVQPEGSVHKSLYRGLTSKLSKSITKIISGNKELTKISSFRIMRGPLARATASVSGHDTYFDVALTWFSNRIVVAKRELSDRRFSEENQSGYNLRSLMSHLRRMMFTGQLKILRVASLIGVLSALIALIFSIVLVCVKVFYPSLISVQGWTTQILATLFMGGLSISLIGVILELLTILTLKANGRPTSFVIDRTIDLAVLEKINSNQHSQ